MIKNMNNKGFTLIELLAVLAILTAIMGIAIPSISSSLERSKEKQNESIKKMLVSFAELYVTDHKNAVYNAIGAGTSCYISIRDLKDEGYANEESVKDADDKELIGDYILFTKPSSYVYVEASAKETGIPDCK